MRNPTVSLPAGIPDMRYTGESIRRRAVHQLQQSWPVMVDAQKIVIPRGYTTDLGSVPAVAWPIVSPNNPKLIPCYVIHDLLYGAELFSRKYADKIFLEAMRVRGVKAWRRSLIYASVRLFGWVTYKEHSKGSIKHIRGLMGITRMKRPLWEPGGVYLTY